MQTIRLVLIFLLMIQLVIASEPEWSFEDPYHNKLAYLHTLINYDFNALWHNNWEKNYFKGNGFLISVGSVTTDELHYDASLVLNESLGKGWWFRGEGRIYESFYLSKSSKYTYMGLEKKITLNTSLYLIVNPAYNKEDTHLNMGFLITDSSRENYLRSGLVMEDFVYDEKNSLDGVSDQTPLSFQWRARFQKDNFALFSQGRWSRGYKRRYPNQELSPYLTAHNQRTNNAQVKIYFFPSEQSLLNLTYFHYDFDEMKQFVSQQYNYRYKNQFNNLSFEYLTKFILSNRFRLKMYYLNQHAGSHGYNAHDFKREDLLSGISYERYFSAHSIEFQYLFAIVRTEYGTLPYNETQGSNSFRDKIKLGWMYTFPQGSKFYISLSHEIRGGEFGGANLLYMLLF
jgi:hypothetical protein